jgi:hypothetical protein
VAATTRGRDNARAEGTMLPHLARRARGRGGRGGMESARRWRRWSRRKSGSRLPQGGSWRTCRRATYHKECDVAGDELRSREQGTNPSELYCSRDTHLLYDRFTSLWYEFSYDI